MTPRPARLLVVTDSYPYDVALEATFLEPELPHLVREFDQVILVPQQRAGRRGTPPKGVEVDESLAEIIEAQAGGLRTLLNGLISRGTWGELVRFPALSRSLAGTRRLLWWSARSSLVAKWARSGGRGRDPDRTVAYTFWCDAATTGFAAAKGSGGPKRVVSRAHGYDLYPDRHDPPYIPHRLATLRRLDRLFPDSAAGTAYVNSQFPWFGRSSLERMGVTDPQVLSRPSQAGAFAIVSCSRIVPVKRVTLIADAVASAARERPSMDFTWRHFGDGEPSARRALEQHAARVLPPNARADFRGYESRTSLMTAYSTMPTDVFVNASSSEGTPVSLMEAASAAIPLVATAVGGNPEVVTGDAGLLVEPDADAKELSAALLRIADDPSLGRRFAGGSRAVWRERYDAESNYTAFGARLRALLDRPE